jgi:hypothetical protein
MLQTGSSYGAYLRGVNGELTHPAVASLDHPLFACGGKRVEEKGFFYPLFCIAEERVDQRSVVGVSQRRG